MDRGNERSVDLHIAFTAGNIETTADDLSGSLSSNENETEDLIS
jgi:hypothetical protein